MTHYTRITEDFRYVVIKTDYTCKLVEPGRARVDFNKSLRMYTYIEDNDDNIDDYIELMFVYDEQWGKGIYKTGSNKEEVDRVIKYAKKTGVYENGIACFKCGNTRMYYALIGTIFKNTYCKVFNVSESCMFNNANDSSVNIKYVRFGTESG